jgi:prepilin peptidase dependent protein B
MRMNTVQRRAFSAGRRRAAGISMVELMVGIAISLIVVGGGLSLLANFTGENRRLLLETRLNQDLRAAMDVVTRDLRRAGHWQGSTAGIWVNGGPNVPPQNAYRYFYDSACNASALGASAPIPPAAASHVCYAIAGDADNAVNETTRAELYGFHLANGVLYAVINGGAQQAVTDPGTITISQFVVTPSSTSVPMTGFCRYTCTVNCPRVIVREFDIQLQGRVPSDATIQRQLRSNVRVRNDYYDGQCPTS